QGRNNMASKRMRKRKERERENLTLSSYQWSEPVTGVTQASHFCVGRHQSRVFSATIQPSTQCFRGDPSLGLTHLSRPRCQMAITRYLLSDLAIVDPSDVCVCQR
uniref:Uncharacterized protein n=1 Tax=Monopterus albus TaxID=43700 RepID=A0A3Q3IAB2_MONAL